jgi:hypothetical protein
MEGFDMTRTGFIAIAVLALLQLQCSTKDSSVAPNETTRAGLSTGATGGPVYVMTWANANCALYPSNNAQDTLNIFADDLGVAQFVAIHANSGDYTTELTLACQYRVRIVSTKFRCG